MPVGSVSCRADCDIPDLPVRGEIAQQDEISDAPLKRLLVKLGAENLHIKLRADRRVRYNDVQVLESEILQGKRRACGRLRVRQRQLCERCAADAGQEFTTFHLQLLKCSGTVADLVSLHMRFVQDR
jgi:hypothetical protein